MTFPRNDLANTIFKVRVVPQPLSKISKIVTEPFCGLVAALALYIVRWVEGRLFPSAHHPSEPLEMVLLAPLSSPSVGMVPCRFLKSDAWFLWIFVPFFRLRVRGVAMHYEEIKRGQNFHHSSR